MNECCIQGLDRVPASLRGCILTIGNFDGVHLGHQRILDTARAPAEAKGLRVAALTFHPSAEEFFRPDAAGREITPPEAKCRLLLQAGADYVVIATFDATVMRMTAEDFIRNIIVRTFSPALVVEGPDFAFGQGRAGNVQLLQAAGRNEGFDVRVVEPVMAELGGSSRCVSSTLIRELVEDGQIEAAALCLGRQFALYGRVVPGARRGRMLAFPTANIDSGRQVIPGDGVYAGRAEVGGREYTAAVSIGDNPTFGANERTIEAHLLNTHGDFYDEVITLRFLRRLRRQKRFPDAEALKAQIAKDIKRVRKICE